MYVEFTHAGAKYRAKQEGEVTTVEIWVHHVGWQIVKVPTKKLLATAGKHLSPRGE